MAGVLVAAGADAFAENNLKQYESLRPGAGPFYLLIKMQDPI